MTVMMGADECVRDPSLCVQGMGPRSDPYYCGLNAPITDHAVGVSHVSDS